jgi:hypothetical protein
VSEKLSSFWDQNDDHLSMFFWIFDRWSRSTRCDLMDEWMPMTCDLIWCDWFLMKVHQSDIMRFLWKHELFLKQKLLFTGEAEYLLTSGRNHLDSQFMPSTRDSHPKRFRNPRVCQECSLLCQRHPTSRQANSSHHWRRSWYTSSWLIQDIQLPLSLWCARLFGSLAISGPFEACMISNDKEGRIHRTIAEWPQCTRVRKWLPAHRLPNLHQAWKLGEFRCFWSPIVFTNHGEAMTRWWTESSPPTDNKSMLFVSHSFRKWTNCEMKSERCHKKVNYHRRQYRHNHGLSILSVATLLDW